MTTIKGPGIFLAQFLGDKPPFDNLRSICLWAESLGFKAVQIPTWDPRCIDLQKAAKSKNYADELEKADLQKLTRLVKIAAVLLQTKVYLFWKVSVSG